VPLSLSPDHPFPLGSRPGAASGGRALRVGIVNIMPRAEEYEPLLLRRLETSARLVEPVFIRLERHLYKSSDAAHLARHYVRYEDSGRLDGLIVTGAPVEELPFDRVHYWHELGAILLHAQSATRSCLGLCWGGLAVGALLGVPKRSFSRKLFGVFEERVLTDDEIVSSRPAPTRRFAHSRHSGSDESALASAAREGVVRLLVQSAATGTSVFASPDHRLVAHLGHPEYEVERILFEWRRDREAGRTDVPDPVGVDPSAPSTTWRADGEAFFQRWIELIADGRTGNGE